MGFTLNRVIIFEHQIKDQEIIIDHPATLFHIAQHLKLQKGETLKITCLGKGLATAAIKSISRDKVVLNTNSLRWQKIAQRWINLFVAVSRPVAIKRIIEHGSALPIKSIHFFQAQLSEKSFFSSKELLPQRIQQRLLDGLAQSGRYHDLPEISIQKKTLKEISRLLQSTEQTYFLDVNSTTTFLDQAGLQVGQGNALNLIVGPERGFSAQEVQWLKDQNFANISIGMGIMRVEMATLIACSQLEMMALAETDKRNEP